MHIHIVLCCGAKRVLFTNKLSECCFRISNPYLFTKFHASQHFGKSYKTCMFFVVGKLIRSYIIFGHKWYFSEIFGIQISVDMCCALKSFKVRIS